MYFKLLSYVALGGALGAVCRFLLIRGVEHWYGFNASFGTFLVNVIGSFLLGLLIPVMNLIWSTNETVKAMLVFGLLGSFTTFSAFSRDCFLFFEKGDFNSAFIYVLGSVILSLLGFWLGLSIMRNLCS